MGRWICSDEVVTYFNGFGSLYDVPKDKMDEIWAQSLPYSGLVILESPHISRGNLRWAQKRSVMGRYVCSDKVLINFDGFGSRNGAPVSKVGDIWAQDLQFLRFLLCLVNPSVTWESPLSKLLWVDQLVSTKYEYIYGLRPLYAVPASKWGVI